MGMALMGCTPEVGDEQAPADASTAAPQMDAQADAMAEPDGQAMDGSTDPLDGSTEPLDGSSEAGNPLPGEYNGPDTLAETGLYQPGTQVLAEGVRAYAPRFTLWSDGSAKQRWVWLPPGTQVDTSDMDLWRFPVGTKLWKEFTRATPGGADVRTETRLLERTEEGWLGVSFLWNEAQTEATALPFGQDDVLGTDHDVPTIEDCFGCHDEDASVPLGFSAIQLAGADSDVTLASLRAEGRLSVDPGTDEIALPGDATAQAALGMLHANCGNCHRPDTFAFTRTDLELHLPLASLGSVEQTPAYVTSVGVENEKRFDEWPLRIDPDAPADSAMYGRMRSRTSRVGMPPIGSELPDEQGAQVLLDWIESL